ncbi:MAG: hypothetical protein AB2L14_29015 [Candidatus Xenobiia bacterium LiM19]
MDIKTGYNANLSQVGQSIQRSKSMEKADESRDKDSVEINGDKGYLSNLKASTIKGALNGFEKVGDAVNHKLHEVFMPTGDGLDHPGTEIAIGMTAAVCGSVGAVAGAAIGFGLGIFGKSV